VVSLTRRTSLYDSFDSNIFTTPSTAQAPNLCFSLMNSFFAFMLLDVLNISKTLSFIIRSMTDNTSSLCWVFYLFSCTVAIYTQFGKALVPISFCRLFFLKTFFGIWVHAVVFHLFMYLFKITLFYRQDCVISTTSLFMAMMTASEMGATALYLAIF